MDNSPAKRIRSTRGDFEIPGSVSLDDPYGGSTAPSSNSPAPPSMPAPKPTNGIPPSSAAALLSDTYPARSETPTTPQTESAIQGLKNLHTSTPIPSPASTTAPPAAAGPGALPGSSLPSTASLNNAVAQQPSTDEDQAQNGSAGDSGIPGITAPVQVR